ncbi:MAG TPA: hypothetical protein VF533_22225 [Solirubrobacteraceae bacterium]|jgi:hypothetical protein
MPRVLIAALVALALPAAAVAADAPTGWDGANPFRCAVQPAGFEAQVADPAADPYCVEFDKRRQNVSELGVVDFLSKEPARVAAATPKCFYFQSDHWRGSVVQSDGTTKTYEWDGHYFFDKATGDGGVWVTNFNVNGRTENPALVPGMPPEYARHMGPGTGGVRSRNAVGADPTCVAKAAAPGARIYAEPAALEARRPRCGPATGTVTRRGIGPLGLGETEAALRARVGTPARVHRGFLRYCVEPGAKLMAGFPGDRSGERGTDEGAADRVTFVLTTAAAYTVRGVGPGMRARAFRRAFGHERKRLTIGRTRVYELRRRSPILVGTRLGRVRFIAVRDRGAVRGRRALRSWLRRTQ